LFVAVEDFTNSTSEAASDLALSFNKRIETFFKDPDAFLSVDEAMNALRMFLKANPNDLTKDAVVTVLQCCTKHKQSLSQVLPVKRAAQIIQADPTPMLVRQIGAALYGLRSVDISEPGSAEILTALTEEVSTHKHRHTNTGISFTPTCSSCLLHS
jgi:hypothetical protein